MTAPEAYMARAAQEITTFDEAFRAIGQYVAEHEDIERDGLIDTPRRLAKSRLELLDGYERNPHAILSTTFESDCDEMVVSNAIEFYSMCEHHWLPFYGKAYVGYIPNGRVVGLSKLARVVDAYARRLQIQEGLTRQIAEAINTTLAPKGVGVVLNGYHLCQMARGVAKQNSYMTTSSMLGEFREDARVRDEFLQLTQDGRGK